MQCPSLKILFFTLMVGCSSSNRQPASSKKIVLNDIHSKLNETELLDALYPKSEIEVQNIIKRAKKNNFKISISGGKHSMGGQQFGSQTLHISTSSYNKVLHLDKKNGIVEIQSGIQWPELFNWLDQNQKKSNKWVVRQKQTGADRFSVGGSISSNIHGRGLKWKPIVDDIESFVLINSKGEKLNCSREENQELFSLVIGGYGLFGFVSTIKLRLMPRVRLERKVVKIKSYDLLNTFQERIREGHLFGDFQFAIDSDNDDFLKAGILSSYKPVHPEKIIKQAQKKLSPNDWKKLLFQAHFDKTAAFENYSKYYLSTDKQRYWSDEHQLSTYIDDYHTEVDFISKAKVSGSEMISEVYVPRDRLEEFFINTRKLFSKNKVNVIYGTVRLIKEDKVSFLNWAKKDYAAIVFNFHLNHNKLEINKAKEDYRQLFDLALSLEGSFFLTYHRWAKKEQIKQAYPNFVEFLKLKRKYDSNELFESDWYRHYKTMFHQELIQEI